MAAVKSLNRRTKLFFGEIMLKFRKVYNLKIVLLFIAGVFFLNSSLYAIDLPKNTNLRVPLSTSQTQNRLEKALGQINEKTPIADLTLNRDFVNRINIVFEGEEDNLLKEVSSSIQTWIESVSVVDLENILSDILKNTVSLTDLTGEIKIEFYEKGAHKNVYRVTFYSTYGMKFPIIVALKEELGIDRIQQNETEDLKWLSTKKRKELGLTPVYGASFKTKNGKTIYLEEFIEGETARKLEQKGELTRDIKREMVKTIAEIGIMLGNNFPKDVNYGNFVIDRYTNRVVMVDIGNKRFSLPQAIRRKHYDSMHHDSMIAFLLGIFVNYAEKDDNAFIIEAFFEGADNVEAFLQKNNIKRVRKDKTMMQTKEEIIEFLEESVGYLSNVSIAQKEHLIRQKLLSDNPYLHVYFKRNNMNKVEQEEFVEAQLAKVEKALKETLGHRVSRSAFSKGIETRLNMNEQLENQKRLNRGL